jgi:hypothetical protein
LKNLLSNPNSKLEIPSIQKEELRMLIKENDIVEMFLEYGDITRDIDGKVYNEDIYGEFQYYCKEMGERPITQIALSKDLVSK